MPDPTHITVTAPPDRVTPIHEADGITPGGGQLRVRAGVVARVRYSQSVRRSIARGDLIPCNMSGAAAPSIDLADAPEELSARPGPVATKADLDALIGSARSINKETR